MHPLRHPRNAIFVGLLFVFFGVVYYLAPVVLDGGRFLDWSGVVMLGALGIAMALMAYVLIAGSPND
jgi:uncharacterized membrane protein